MNPVEKAILDAGGELLGEIEDLVRGPLYPIKVYREKVTDDLWRGSWQKPEGWAALRSLGIRTVINLCSERSDEAEVLNAGLRWFWAPTEDNTVPQQNILETFLAYMQAPSSTGYPPFFVHCEAGIGRTGVFVACYRIRVCGWKPDIALAEAQNHGLAMPAQIDFILGFR